MYILEEEPTSMLDTVLVLFLCSSFLTFILYLGTQNYHETLTNWTEMLSKDSEHFTGMLPVWKTADRPSKWVLFLQNPAHMSLFAFANNERRFEVPN